MYTYQVNEKLATYFNEARLQQPGYQKRYKECPFCGTGSSQAFVVAVSTRTIRGFCYRCNQRVYEKRETPSISDCLQTAKQVKLSHKAWSLGRHTTNQPTEATVNMGTRQVYLPADVTDEIPTMCWLWLKQYNITPQEATLWNFKWSPSYQRLIIPVYKDGELVYWQGRYFCTAPSTPAARTSSCTGLARAGTDKSKVIPKWLNVKSSRKDALFEAGGSDDSSNVTVLVEDILSAIAVSRAGYCAKALLGCHLTETILKDLVGDNALLSKASESQSEGKQAVRKHVIVWLDLDKRSTSWRYSKRLNVLGVSSFSLSTPKDPKEYLPDFIKSKVEARLKPREVLYETSSEISGIADEDMEQHPVHLLQHESGLQTG